MNPQIEVSSFFFVNIEVFLILYRNINTKKHKLYSYLERLNKRVLFSDTDSVFLVLLNGEYEPSVGPFLKDIIDKLERLGVASYIISFVLNGPKFYGYIVCKPDGTSLKVCKMKEIKSNFKNIQFLNLSTIKVFSA